MCNLSPFIFKGPGVSKLKPPMTVWVFILVDMYDEARSRTVNTTDTVGRVISCTPRTFLPESEITYQWFQNGVEVQRENEENFSLPDPVSSGVMISDNVECVLTGTSLRTRARRSECASNDESHCSHIACAFVHKVCRNGHHLPSLFSFFVSAAGFCSLMGL